MHPKVRSVIAGFAARELHAAQSGREVMDALAAVAADSPATSTESLAAELEAEIDSLQDAMPAYAPPRNVIHRVYREVEDALASGHNASQLRLTLIRTAAAYDDWSTQARRQIASQAAALIPSGSTVLTFTLSETVMEVLRQAQARGVRFRVLVTESRPNNDGRMTARSLSDLGVDVGIGIDASVAELAACSDLMLVGAEAILSDGSSVCKVGTYPTALAARRAGIPIYVVVDTLKLHVGSLFGESLPLDPIGALEVEPSDGAAVVGHLFDRTPPGLITALVTERGIIHPSQAGARMLEMPFSHTLAERMRTTTHPGGREA